MVFKIEKKISTEIKFCKAIKTYLKLSFPLSPARGNQRSRQFKEKCRRQRCHTTLAKVVMWS
ncbi:hypothetical protein SAMN04515618_10637 [Collimonas sp. OK307]|nr:hypothetical protein SAMN04515618_10637 [Collimonas sp. OK307]